MTIPVTCTCGRRIRVKPGFSGRRIECPFCGESVEVSEPVEELANEAEADLAPTTSKQGPPPRLHPPIGKAHALPSASRWTSGSANVLALVSALLGVVAAGLYGGVSAVSAVVVGSLGLVLSTVALFVSAVSSRVVPSAPLMGILFCGTIASLALLAPRDFAAMAGSTRRVAARIPTSAGIAPALEHYEGGGTAGLPIESTFAWTDASHSARKGDFEVRIVSATVGHPKVRKLFSDEAAPWKDAGLIIAVEFKNVGTTRWVEYRPSRYRVWDNDGHAYRELDLGSANLVGRQDLGDRKLKPGKTLKDFFVFEPPATEVQTLRMEIPGDVVGLETPFRFELPARMINREPSNL